MLTHAFSLGRQTAQKLKNDALRFGYLNFSQRGDRIFKGAKEVFAQTLISSKCKKNKYIKIQMELDKKDSVILDSIIEKVIEKDSPLWSYDFRELEFSNIVDDKLRELEFRRLLNIIKYKGVGKVLDYTFSGDSIQRNENTLKFKERGGFTKLYHDELERIDKETEIELLKNKKLRWDAKISKWQVKTFWPVFVFGLFGFIFGIYNFNEQRKEKKLTKELKQDNLYIKEELSKLRTLVLDKKNLDYLHNSKTQADALKLK